MWRGGYPRAEGGLQAETLQMHFPPSDNHYVTRYCKRSCEVTAMKSKLPRVVAGCAFLAILLVLTAGDALAETFRIDSDKEREANDLRKRIRSSRSTAGKKDKAEEDDETDLDSPEERKARAKRRAKRKALLSGKPEKKEELITDPNELRKRMGSVPRIGAKEMLDEYRMGTSTKDLLKRIQQSRSGELQEGKEKRKKEAGERVTREPVIRDFRSGLPDYSLDTKIDRDFRRRLNVIGVGGLAGEQERLRNRMIGGPTRRTRVADLPDPAKDFDLYKTRLRSEFGERGTLPSYVDPKLAGVQETRRFDRWITNEFGARLEPGRASLPQAYNAYKSLASLPPLDTSRGRRDVYVPYSTNFLNPIYRGGIYGAPLTSDPYQRNYGPTLTESKYSQQEYLNTGVRESFADYYRREFGVGTSFVPESSSRYYDINTMNQWQAQLRRSGVDTRGANTSYSDLYRLQTSK